MTNAYYSPVPTYPLKGTFVAYMRRDKASTLLFSMARQLAMLEPAGLSVEQVFTYFSEGEYVGVALVQDPRDPLKEAGVGASSDDLKAVDETLNQRATKEAARLRQIEAFKQAERERLAKLAQAQEENQ